MKLANLIIVGFFICLPSIGFSATDVELGSDLKIAQGFSIIINDYDKASRTYKVSSIKFPGEGFSMVTAEGLNGSINHFKYKLSKSNPQSLVSRRFMLDRPLPTLSEIEMRHRSNGIFLNKNLPSPKPPK